MKIMTKEEAIKILSTRDAHGVLCGYTSGVTEALDMAIEALSTNAPIDPINRRDALEQIAQAECGLHYDDCEADNCSCSYIQRILDIPSAEAEWIPCSERLPDIGNRCLVTLSNNVVAIGTLHNEDNKRWHLEPASMMIAYHEDSVTAWMPLPKPYRKDDEHE